jgi:hypothetical protein
MFSFFLFFDLLTRYISGPKSLQIARLYLRFLRGFIICAEELKASFLSVNILIWQPFYISVIPQKG